MSYRALGDAPLFKPAPIGLPTTSAPGGAAPIARTEITARAGTVIPRIPVPPECAEVTALLTPAGLADLLRVPSLPEELENRYLIWAWPSSRLESARTLSGDDLALRSRAIYDAWKNGIRGYLHIKEILNAAGYGVEPVTRTFYMIVQVKSHSTITRAALTQARAIWQNKIGAAFGTRMAILSAEGVLPTSVTPKKKYGEYWYSKSEHAVNQAAAAAIGGAIDNLRAALVRATGPSIRSLLPAPMSGVGAIAAALASARALPAAAAAATSLADEVMKRAPELLRVGVSPDDGLAAVRQLRSMVSQARKGLEDALSNLDRGEEASRAEPSASARLRAELADPATPGRLVENVRQKILARVPGIERDFPDELRRRYVVCAMWENAARVDIPGYMATLPRAIAEAEEYERAFATARAAAAAAFARLDAADALLSDVESRLDFPWYRKRLGPLPVWGWGLIATGTALGGAALVRAMR